jgi:hypothetical protein
MSGSVPVRDEETLARYVLSASWLYKDGRAGNPLRPNAWLPHPTVELSVFRTDGWSEFEIVDRGEQVAAEREAKHRESALAQGREYPSDKVTFRYQGRGEILAKEVRATGLDVVPKEPPPRHADIVNWPPLTGNRKHDEAGQMVFAMKLQSHAGFVASV